MLPLPAAEDLADIAWCLLNPPGRMSIAPLDVLPPPVVSERDTFGPLINLQLEQELHEKIGQELLLKSPRPGGRSLSASSHGVSPRRATGSFVASALIQTGPLSTLNLASSTSSSAAVEGTGDQDSHSTANRMGITDSKNPSGPKPEGSLISLKLSSEVAAALQRPGSAYLRPHQGQVTPEGTLIRNKLVRKPTIEEMLSALHAEAKSLADAKASGEEPPMSVTRPGSSAAPSRYE